jgi:hypothetical protein
MSYQQLAPGQTYPETPINENMESLGQAFLYAHDPPNSADLVVAFGGGTFNVATVAGQVVTCTDDDETYIVALRADGTLSAAITTTNWDNTATYGRVARATFVAGAMTALADERWSAGGIFDHAADGALAAAEDVSVADAGTYYTGTDVEAALQEVGASLESLSGGGVSVSANTDFPYTSNTDTTADTGPGAGLVHWSNADQGAAIYLYVSDAPTNGLDINGLFAEFDNRDIFVTVAQNGDPTRFQVWRAAGTETVYYSDYARFRVHLLVEGAADIQDNKALTLRFAVAGPSTAPVIAVPFIPSKPAAGACVCVFAAPAGIVTLNAYVNMDGSSGKALTAATAQADFSVRKNAVDIAGGTEVAVMRFAAAATVPSFINASTFSLGTGDWISVWAPASQDATLANISASFFFWRQL